MFSFLNISLSWALRPTVLGFTCFFEQRQGLELVRIIITAAAMLVRLDCIEALSVYRQRETCQTPPDSSLDC
ncbi:hypothetical protein HMPREF0580_0530 [Mobiluncus mulieris ATCC 35239]|uniref:Uncharacterized protein n=1 Tax=Mobiluncus mulieris ATCC 35239 TaxID=871571 RepID=E0QNR6_9ACTO|nr:hypothetical protein HMPREF0580_0530 [Mobiluncus mulieris ATCC 35239]